MTAELQGYYAASATPPPPRPALTGELRADVCVIGGGYTGLSAAFHAARAGAKVVLVEAQTIGFAASGRNGGQIHPGHRKDQAALEAWLGETHARDLWRLSEEARGLVFELAAEDCDLKRGLVIAAHSMNAAHDLAKDAAYLDTHYGYRELRMLDRAKAAAMLGTTAYPAARFDGGGGHLHPLKFARRLAALASGAGAALHENSPTLAVDREQGIVRTAQGSVRADRIVLACDAFSATLAPELAPFIAHVESFLVATAPLGERNARVLPSDAAVANTRHVLDYYRKSADGRLIFAGRESYWNPPRDIIGLVRPRLRLRKVFPDLAEVPIDYGWRGTVGITRTRMPHFGRLGPHVLFGHGYSGHGVALSVLGGKALAQAALGQPERFDILANVPPRKFPGGALLRKPMVTAALTMLKLADLL